jgi:predicted N-acetyltransferase YhbS
MSNYELIRRKPTAGELLSLREAVGWGSLDKDRLQKGLDNSLFGVCAVAGDAAIGTARVVGDGFTVFYIQDVIVNPAFQRMGVGMAMMQAVMDYICEKACEGAVVGLMSAKGKEEFYKRFGFWTRPGENYGAGMVQFWESKKREIPGITLQQA